MGIKDYLPSAQFTLIVSSVVLSGGLVLAAQYVTGPKESATLATSPVSQDDTNAQWQQTLQNIQAQNPLDSLPPAPDPSAVSDLLAAAKTTNVTDTVGRTLLINLSQAKSQGLGSDIPTQNALVAQALAQVDQGRGTPTYTSANLTLAEETPTAHKTYGNDVMAVVALHTNANYANTLLAVGDAIDTGKDTKLSQLGAIQADYRAATQALVALPVPPTLEPFHLQIVNDMADITKSFDDMKLVLSDPLRGLAGLQTYETLTGELSRVFTNIAQGFSKDGILFTKDEPGNAWSLLVSQP